MKFNTDVLITGAGPAGLMLACELAIRNIPFRIIDRSPAITLQSRAIAIQSRTLEVFEQMGIAEKIIPHGLIAKEFKLIYRGKKTIDVNIKGDGLTKFPYVFMFKQSQTEKVLNDFLERHGKRVERSTELTDFSQDDDAVNAIVKTPDGEKEIIRCKYLVGCDGASSMVREKLGMNFNGKKLQQPLFVIDCGLRLNIPKADGYLTFTDKAVISIFPLPGGSFRLWGTIPKQLRKKSGITFEDIAKDLDVLTGIDVSAYDPEWISLYYPQHRYAPAFKIGRCLLAGDAAHVHSPLGGHGMNTGIQDSYNLAWKLAMVIKGEAKDVLLNTYQEERLPVAKKLVRTSDKEFSFTISDNALIRLIRFSIVPHVLRLLLYILKKRRSFREYVFKDRSELGINYRKGRLAKNASFGNFTNNAPRPGDRLPYILYEDENGNQNNIQDIIAGPKFHLLNFNNSHEKDCLTIKPDKELFIVHYISLHHGNKILFKKFGIKESGWYLIRPDMYIAYRSSETNVEHFIKYITTYFKEKSSN